MLCSATRRISDSAKFHRGGQTRQCTPEIKLKFVDFVHSKVDRGGCIVLGCTELPVLYDKCKAELGDMNFYDPMLIVLEKLRAEFESF